MGQWLGFEYPILLENGDPAWIEHPRFGKDADVIALPIKVPPSVQIYPYNVRKPNNELLIRPSDVVSVIGFPFGKSAGGMFPIWVSGFLASEMNVNYDDMPIFLIDCRTRQGQSGSPVLAVRYDTVTYKNGDIAMGATAHAELLGIYSGRINEQSDIGKVWKRSLIDELVSSIKPIQSGYHPDFFTTKI